MTAKLYPDSFIVQPDMQANIPKEESHHLKSMYLGAAYQGGWVGETYLYIYTGIGLFKIGRKSAYVLQCTSPMDFYYCRSKVLCKNF